MKPLLTVIMLWLAALPASAQITTAPSPRAHHAGVYDSVRHEMLVYGGYSFDGQVRAIGDRGPGTAGRGASLLTRTGRGSSPIWPTTPNASVS